MNKRPKDASPIKLVEQIVGMLARDLSQATVHQVAIETQRHKLFGTDIVELRVFLRKPPNGMAPDPWLWHYRRDLVPVLQSAGLELAVDDWFTPSQQLPSCSCWIKCCECQADASNDSSSGKSQRHAHILTYRS